MAADAVGPPVSWNDAGAAERSPARPPSRATLGRHRVDAVAEGAVLLPRHLCSPGAGALSVRVGHGEVLARKPARVAIIFDRQRTGRARHSLIPGRSGNRTASCWPRPPGGRCDRSPPSPADDRLCGSPLEGLVSTPTCLSTSGGSRAASTRGQFRPVQLAHHFPQGRHASLDAGVAACLGPTHPDLTPALNPSSRTCLSSCSCARAGCPGKSFSRNDNRWRSGPHEMCGPRGPAVVAAGHFLDPARAKEPCASPASRLTSWCAAQAAAADHRAGGLYPLEAAMGVP